MSFNSTQFLVFFPLVVVLYFSIPYRYRWLLLLGSSCYFYMSWKPEYIILLFASTSVDYWMALEMAKTAVLSKRKKFLLISLCSNLGILFAFKYFNFFNDSVRAIFNQFNIFYGVPAFELLLPIGISFYTFHALSYTIDVYRGIREPERHFGMFMLYVTFFPQLVAGPISRAAMMLPELYKNNDFDYRRVISGLQLMLWGFFKKVVIADRLAIVVNNVYNNPTQYSSGVPFIVATYFFAFQIYCDFSGYSDIAIGAAKVMGYDLMQNFRRPYFSKSIGEFWQRWHISLSTWFRDYLYTPLLQSNRLFKRRWHYNLMIVFLVSGLWHGANWTFVVWGGLHGFYLLCSFWTRSARAQLARFLHSEEFPVVRKAVQVFITFHLVTFAWIFFRANSLSDALYIVSHLFSGIELKMNYGTGLGLYELLVVILAISFMELVHLKERGASVRQYLAERPLWIRWPAYYTLIFAILLFGKFGTVEFIYFQF